MNAPIVASLGKVGNTGFIVASLDKVGNTEFIVASLGEVGNTGFVIASLGKVGNTGFIVDPGSGFFLACYGFWGECSTINSQTPAVVFFLSGD